MDTHIDWLSFTLPSAADVSSTSDLYLIARELLKGISNEHEAFIFDGQGIEPTLNRRPYNYALERSDSGVRIYGGGHIGNILFEITGRACEAIRSYESAAMCIAPICDNLSRLDVAVDIRTETRPSDFSNRREGKAFKSVGYMSSSTGETCYVGSAKSDRFARVYRYNEPHPRAALLRIEFVFRRGLARSAAQQLLTTGGYARFVAQLGNTWGWKHKDWQPEVSTDEKIKAPIVTRGNDQTVHWLYTQVAPAIRRLIKEDAFDPIEFWEHVTGVK